MSARFARKIRIHWSPAALLAAQETRHEDQHRQVDHQHRIPEREALARSEKDASRRQPGSYKDDETAEKVVSIPPAGPGKKPIRGLDPK